MKPQYATNPDGIPVALITPPIPDAVPYTLDELKEKIIGLQDNIGMADSSIADLTNQIQKKTDEKVKMVAELADVQSVINGFPADVQPIDPQPLPPQQIAG